MGLHYITDDAVMEVKEDEVILYDDKETLHRRICEMMSEIREKEAKKNDS